MNNINTAPVAALVIRRTFAAPRAQVFAAWTTPEVLRRWFCPDRMTLGEFTFEARVGAAYRITMLASDGETFTAFGTIRELRAPERLAMTWQWEGDDGKPEGNETRLSIDLHDRGAATELVLTHENLAGAESRDRHEHGWNSILDKLPAVLG